MHTNVNILMYIRRNPELTRESFYEYWAGVHGPLCVPWAEACGIQGYRQMHVSGEINGKEFDGIAAFEAESLDKFHEAFQHHYYKEVIDLDEFNLIDKKSADGGITAVYSGKTVVNISSGESTLGDEDAEYRLQWEEHHKRIGKLLI
ncbi:hypothetical protein NA57DRAFT_71054 [Rhizodiscina lignyota]|uniref:EthD domain-containing protein n=1 Tax=Rhizodiscina lignyota TaxID=1504668 RepID=A0A9P4IT16_9PEZI|nr:hypothetical protein NA57DRAFT_71054 [Rhizodiscina lignyota]